MSGWNSAIVGLKVRTEERMLAQQFLKTVCGSKEERVFYDEVGRLSIDFAPEIKEVIDYHSRDVLEILRSLNSHEEAYTDQFIEGIKKSKSIKAPPVLDKLFCLTSMLFPSSFLFVAHEEGNSVTDAYYRYEVIYDPSKAKKTESHCFYCYGDGINVETGNPKQEGTERKESKISDKVLNSKSIETLIDKAREEGFSELAERLNLCK